MVNKIAVIMMLLFVAISAAGCQTAAEIDNAVAGNQYDSFNEYVYNQDEVQEKCVKSTAITSDGYYYTANRVLWFYDLKSDTNIPMCSKSNCNHKDASCDAYVDETNPMVGIQCNCESNEVFYYNNQIYMIERSADNETMLYQYNSNFNDKKLVATLSSFPKDSTLFGGADACIISEGYFYYYIQKYDVEKKDYNGLYSCMRLNLTTDEEPEVLGSFEYAGDYALMAGDSNGVRVFLSSDNVYFIAGGTSRNYSKINPVQYRIAKYNKTSKEFQMIWTYTGDTYEDVWGQGLGKVDTIINNISMDDSGKIYVLATGKDKQKECCIAMVDKENDNYQIIYETEYDYIDQIASDGENLYIIEVDDATPAVYFTALDYSGTVLQRKEIEYSDALLKQYQESGQKLSESLGGIIIYGLDDRYILLGGSANRYKNMSTSLDIVDIVDHKKAIRTTYGMAVMNKKDFLAGKNIDLRQIYRYEE